VAYTEVEECADSVTLTFGLHLRKHFVSGICFVWRDRSAAEGRQNFTAGNHASTSAGKCCRRQSLCEFSFVYVVFINYPCVCHGYTALFAVIVCSGQPCECNLHVI